MSDEVRAYEAANAYLNEGLIRLAASLAPRDSDALDGPHGAARLVGPQLSRRLRMLRFLPRLGHPERTFPAVHVGGTSGKGSTATLIAELLHAHGVGTGLHVTPYLQVCTEKLWARGRYASGRELASLVEWVRPHAEACRGADVPMHGMASVAITLEHYRREAVAVGVVEVGVGGHNDITNVLDTRVAVIGAVGLDHLKTLGPGIDDIAWHKAGIIHAGARAVVLRGAGLAAAEARAAAVGAPLRVVSPQVPGLRLDARGCACFDFAGRGARFEQLRVGLPGAFQAQNATLALAAYEELLEGGVIDVPLEERAVRVALASARLPGRAEHIGRELSGRCDVLLDGAHNADKIAALASTLEATGAQLHLVTGALSGRAVADALAPLARRARTVVASEPRVYAKPAQPAAELAAALAAHHDGRVFAERDASRALDLALDRAGADDLVVVTGSLYLVGALRDRFYPWQRVLIERTSWPATRAAS